MNLIVNFILLIPLCFCLNHHPSLPRCNKLNLKQRKNVLDLSPNELNRYFNAISKLSVGKKVSRWQAWADVARDRLNSQANDTLYWQRVFLLGVERDLQRIDSTVTIPYWDWSDYVEKPLMDPVLQRSKLGAISDGKCIKLTQMKNFNPVQYDLKSDSISCIQRQVDWEESGFPTYRELNRNILNLDMLKFLESTLRDLWPKFDIETNNFIPIQPEDPLFISHLAFLDKLWFDWQNRNPLLYYRSLSPGKTLVSTFNIPLKQIVDPCTRICSNYQENHFSWRGKNMPIQGKIYQC